MSCFISGCKTGYKSEKRKNKELGVKNPSLFKPCTKDMLKNWQNALARPGKLFTEKDRVCSRHFNPDQIETEYVTVMPDGTVNRIPKGKPTLKPTAVPLTLLQSATKSLSMSNEKHLQNRTNHFEVEDSIAQKKVKNDANTPQVQCELACKKIMTMEQTADLIKGDLSESVPQDEVQFKAESLSESFRSIPLPSPFWTSNIINDSVVFTSWTENLDTVAKRVVVHKDLSFRIFMFEKEITIPGLQSVESVKHIARSLTTISNILPCRGVGDNNEHANGCSGYVFPKKHNQTGQQSTRCFSCKKLLKSCSKEKKAKQPLQREKQKNYKLRRRHENVKRRNNTLTQKNAKLRQKVKDIQNECSKAKTEAVEAAISNLPENQQLAVQTCFTASKIKSSKSMRYTNEWIFQCLLLRIKSKKLYEHLRAHKILILPCVDTLNKYIKAIKGVYGFDTATFKVLKEKVKHMNPQEKHGVILLDEMKLTKSISFDRESLKLQGFTNLGNYTPDHQKNKRG